MTEKLKLPSYGGQALIEGVLMRSRKFVSSAFRLPDGSIKTQTEELSGIYKSKVFTIPFLRGLVSLWDSLVLGTRYLTISANYQAKEGEKIEGGSLFFSLLLSLVIGVGIFILGPAMLGNWLGKALHWSVLLTNIFEGILRLVIIIVYLVVVGKMKDIHRVFQYHGAEHKTINSFEKGIELSPQEVMKQSNYHPRCGTAFLLTFAVISILVFALFGKLPIYWLILSRIAALPLIAMLAYEYIRFLGNHTESKLIKIISSPNMWLQRLSTRPPELDQVEVAIAAFNELMAHENAPKA